MATQSQHRYLLILGCSKCKRPDPGLLPAIERYNGVNFRVLRKAKREGYWSNNLDVLILSAKYGLLEWDKPIENYDLRMTRERALELQSTVSAQLNACLSRVNYREVFINLGQTYLVALAQARKMLGLKGKTHYATGGIGEKMAQMKSWLYHVAQEDRSKVKSTISFGKQLKPVKQGG